MKSKLVLFLLIAGTSIYADNIREGFLRSESFSFLEKESGHLVNFNSSIEVLSQVFGCSNVSEDIQNDIQFTKISWPGLDIHVISENTILLMTITSNTFSTVDGVSIGDDVKKVIEKYGKPLRRNEMRIQYYYSTFEETWSLVFYISNNKVESIRIHRLD